MAPSVESVDNLWLGILLDPHQATVVHDLGPYGGSAEVDISAVVIISSSSPSLIPSESSLSSLSSIYDHYLLLPS